MGLIYWFIQHLVISPTLLYFYKCIDYEIKTSRDNGKSILGVHIHNFKDAGGLQSSKGTNPFLHVTMDHENLILSSVVNTYDPRYFDSRQVYQYIGDNSSYWIEETIKIKIAY